MRFAGQKMFSVVLVSYDPNIRTTYIRNIDVLVSPELQLVGRLTHLANVPASDRGYAAFGTTTYAFAGEGLQFLADETKQFIAERPYIRDLSQEQASRMAKDVVEAASLAERAGPGNLHRTISGVSA